MNFTLYPITWLARGLDQEPFDTSRLPFSVADGLTIESMTDRFSGGAFDRWRERVGGSAIEALERIRFALVHRYDPAKVVVEGQFSDPRTSSEDLVRKSAACLQLIRPMRERAYLVHGSVRDADGIFVVQGFDVPPAELMEVPEVQKLFKLRMRDAEDLSRYLPEFLRALEKDFWKTKMAVQFYSRGHFQHSDWKARYLLWCSAIESIYTSAHSDHQGSLVATSRIKWFLGENTNIYAPGDLPYLGEDPCITVGGIVADVYRMRNFIAHGDRLPDEYFSDISRQGLQGGVIRAEVLLEAVSFIVRSSILKILRGRLLDHFSGGAAAEVFFSAQGLTKTILRQKIAARGGCK
jgi:hypothetical protein